VITGSWLEIALIALIALVIVVLAWWLLIASEGVYLGRRVVIWLYDLFATRYDAIKGFNPLYDQQYLAQPLMERIAPQRQPRVLDVATGTGRLPLALYRHARFGGRVIALDAAPRMLALAADKLNGMPRLLCTLGDGTWLPFADNTFDVVTCLEALEFMPQPEATLRELCRVLRPGGTLMTTHRRTGRLMPGKIISQERMAALLAECRMTPPEFDIWQVDYDLVWAEKRKV
jgi:ubiquinone/menaquinone biosynthesis C-methylase UbiE